jgi:hypothetical protein
MIKLKLPFFAHSHKNFLNKSVLSLFVISVLFPIDHRRFFCVSPPAASAAGAPVPLPTSTWDFAKGE